MPATMAFLDECIMRLHRSNDLRGDGITVYSRAEAVMGRRFRSNSVILSYGWADYGGEIFYYRDVTVHFQATEMKNPVYRER
jgi:predicted membrane GTPase involved in stress response